MQERGRIPIKKLIFIGGTMGVGKTAASRELQKLLPDCVFLDGDWCWDMRPFTVTEETKAMVTDNITHLLRNFLRCPAYQNVIFCWVMHDQSIIDGLLAALEREDFRLWNYSLTCSAEVLRQRLAKDIAAGLREPDVLERSLDRLPLYEKLDTVKLDTSGLSAKEAALAMAGKIGGTGGAFEGVRLLPIDQLGLSQLYLSADKIAAIKEWFRPQNMENFQPLPVRDFGNGRYTLTDGHSRAYVAYLNGVSLLPAVYDNDDLVTNLTGQMLYHADIEWCKRFHLSHIKDLQNRVVSGAAYEKLWRERCDRSHDLLTQTTPRQRMELQALASGLFLYGASEDLSVLYFENAAGDLFSYQDHTLLMEKHDW